MTNKLIYQVILSNNFTEYCEAEKPTPLSDLPDLEYADSNNPVDGRIHNQRSYLYQSINFAGDYDYYMSDHDHLAND